MQPVLDPDLLTDESLLERAKRGDEESFVALYRRRQSAVYRFALQMSGAAQTAEEVTQEVFLLLLRHPGQYDPARGPLAAWLYGIARNLVWKHMRRERPFVAMDDERPAPDASVLSSLGREEEIEAVRQAILSLPEHYREVVVLCELQEQSYEQAAGSLSCAVGTVRSRLHRARALLIEKLTALAVRCLL